MTKTSRKPHVAKDPRFNGMALITSLLSFDKTENDRFQSNSGDVFGTQWYLDYHYVMCVFNQDKIF